MLLWLYRQVAPEFGDGGVVVGQLLLDRQRPAVRLQRLGRLAGLRSAGSRCCGGCPPGRLRNSVTAGLSSASFCRIASARRYDSSASAGLPVCDLQDADVVVAVRQVGCGSR